MFIQRVNRGDFDRATSVHNQYPVGHPGDDTQVMGNPDDGNIEFSLQTLGQFDDLGLHSYVECRGRFIGDHEFWIAGYGHSDHDPLPHTPGKLMGIVLKALTRTGDADMIEKFNGSFASLICPILRCSIRDSLI